MTLKQFFGFLKAPFSKSFIISYLFACFSLFSIPLFSSLFEFVFKNYKEKNDVFQEKLTSFLMQLIHGSEVWFAVVGILVALFLLSLYYFVLTYKTVVEGRGIFDASRITINFLEILSVAPKFIVFFAFFSFALIIPCLCYVALVFLSGLLPNGWGVFLIILGLVPFFYFLYRTFFYFFTASFIFYKEFNLSVFFQYGRIQRIFHKKKQQVLIAFLLSYVATQILQVIFTTMCVNVTKQVLEIGAFLNVFDTSSSVVIAIGLLFGSFVYAYIACLSSIVYGKIILWADLDSAEE